MCVCVCGCMYALKNAWPNTEMQTDILPQRWQLKLRQFCATQAQNIPKHCFNNMSKHTYIYIPIIIHISGINSFVSVYIYMFRKFLIIIFFLYFFFRTNTSTFSKQKKKKQQQKKFQNFLNYHKQHKQQKILLCF